MFALGNVGFMYSSTKCGQSKYLILSIICCGSPNALLVSIKFNRRDVDGSLFGPLLREVLEVRCEQIISSAVAFGIPIDQGVWRSFNFNFCSGHTMICFFLAGNLRLCL